MMAEFDFDDDRPQDLPREHYPAYRRPHRADSGWVVFAVIAVVAAVVIIAAVSSSFVEFAATGVGLAVYLVLFAFGAVWYILPTLIARNRRHPNLVPIFVVNLFLGFSLVGWVVALAWSLMAIEPRHYSRR